MGCLNLLKSFSARSFLWSFMICDKNWPFFILYEKYWISSCSRCLIRNSHVPVCWPAWFARIVVNHSLALTNKFGSSFLIRMIRLRLPSCYTFVITFGIIELFSNPMYCPHWHPNTVKMNANLYSMPFSNFCCRELCHDVAFLADSVQQTQVDCTEDKT